MRHFRLASRQGVRCARAMAIVAGVFLVTGDAPAQEQVAIESAVSTATQVADIPQSVEKFKPWRPKGTYRFADLDFVAPAGGAEAPESDKTFWKALFDGAVLFETDLEHRIVPVGKQPSGVSIDYVEIRRAGNGFGVNSDAYSTKMHIYLEQIRLRRTGDGTGQNDPLGIIEFSAKVNYTGPSDKRIGPVRLSARLVPAAKAAAATASAPKTRAR